MRYRRTIWIIPVLIFAWVVQSRAQVSLYPQVSAETNGMGGAGVSFVSDNALATIANPAELGLFSLHGLLNASYMPTIPGQLSALAVNAGFILNRFWYELPFRMGFGIGYSDPNYSYPSPGLGYQNLTQTDAANGLTFAIGVDYLVRIGLGYTLKWVNTNGVAPYYKSTYSPDFGVMLQIPVMNFISPSKDHSTLNFYNVKPLLNMTFGYSKRNVADYTPYGYAALPREGDFGLNIEIGLKAYIQNYSWKWLSFTWIRQADAPLISPSGRIRVYDNGWGSTQFYNNLIAGRPTGDVSMEKGWQIQIAEFLYFRSGSGTGPYVPTYGTFGWGVRLDGLMKTLLFLHWLNKDETVAKFVLNHLDLQFDYSKNPQNLIGVGETNWFGVQRGSFETLSLVIR